MQRPRHQAPAQGHRPDGIGKEPIPSLPQQLQDTATGCRLFEKRETRRRILSPKGRNQPFLRNQDEERG